MSRKLLLFDIDGTILTGDRLGPNLFQEVLTGECGHPISLGNVSFSGKTDPQIMHEILDRSGYAAPEAERLVSRALRTYAARFQQSIRPVAVTVLPGVRTLLETLSRSYNVLLALLTGNIEETAHLKIQAAGLEGYFLFGAFSSDHAERGELPAIAAQRAFRHEGHRFTGNDIVIIGDSQHDIRCGEDVGAYSVAVATGVTGMETLAAEEPDVLLRDFTDVQAFCSGTRLSRKTVAVDET